MTETHAHRRTPAGRARATLRNRRQYLIFGLAMGGLWLLNLDKPLPEHALQMLAVMTVLTLIQILLDRHHRHGAPAPRGTYARLIGGKIMLLAVAVGSEWLLAPVTDRSNAIVAALLVVLATALGPHLDGRSAKTNPPGTPPGLPLPEPKTHAARH